MSIEPISVFSNSAAGFSRNPLGIIALFIVLVYGFASLTLTLGGNLTSYERVPIVYFLVIFPVLVLFVFTWLVSKHSGKLFAPADFKDEGNFLKAHQQVAVAALVAASSKEGTSTANVQEIVSSVSSTRFHNISSNAAWQRHILWVDDHPENNVYERTAFEAVGFSFSLSLNTEDALRQLESQRFAAIISDMSRKEGPKEGYKLLQAIREKQDKTPLFFYAGSNTPEHQRETIRNGGQGNTNDPSALFQMVTKAIISGSAQ